MKSTGIWQSSYAICHHHRTTTTLPKFNTFWLLFIDDLLLCLTIIIQQLKDKFQSLPLEWMLIVHASNAPKPRLPPSSSTTSLKTLPCSKQQWPVLDILQVCFTSCWYHDPLVDLFIILLGDVISVNLALSCEEQLEIPKGLCVRLLRITSIRRGR